MKDQMKIIIGLLFSCLSSAHFLRSCKLIFLIFYQTSGNRVLPRGSPPRTVYIARLTLTTKMFRIWHTLILLEPVKWIIFVRNINSDICTPLTVRDVVPYLYAIRKCRRYILSYSPLYYRDSTFFKKIIVFFCADAYIKFEHATYAKTKLWYQYRYSFSDQRDSDWFVGCELTIKNQFGLNCWRKRDGDKKTN